MEFGRCWSLTFQNRTKDENDMKECSIGEVTYESELQKYYDLMETFPNVAIGGCIVEIELPFLKLIFGSLHRVSTLDT